MKKWEPWVTFQEELPSLNIPAPPCSLCEYWKPQRKFMWLKGKGMVFDGVICCHYEYDQHRDFSCFKERVS